jgi:hypothetical protein
MLHLSRRAAAINECLDAVRLAQDPARLHEAPAEKLVSAAAACAKTLARVAERNGHFNFKQPASAFHVLARAERLLGRELQRRKANMDH